MAVLVEPQLSARPVARVAVPRLLQAPDVVQRQKPVRDVVNEAVVPVQQLPVNAALLLPPEAVAVKVVDAAQ